MKKKLFSIFLCCCLVIYSKAQTTGYKYYSQLDTVKTSGFYNIQLTPELAAHIKTDHSDIRIINEADKWVPHVLRFPFKETNLISLPIEVVTKTNQEQFTELVLKNNTTFLSEFDIILKNTSASRVAKLSGSDDNDKWFVIEDSIQLIPIVLKDSGKTKYHIEFPACNYKFLKIAIDNKLNDPVNILSVTQDVSLSYQQVNLSVSDNPACMVQQMDSGQLSYIKVRQQHPYHFENFEIKISGVKYFYRRVDMYVPTGENNSFTNPGMLYESFYISNNSALSFKIPLTNAKVFYLLVHNEDNLPVKVDEVSTSSNIRVLSAYLEKGNTYRLIMGNAAAVAPNYDLSQLNTSIPDTASFLNHEKIIAFKEAKPTTVAVKNNKWILWLSIIVALFILLFFTKRMMKEVDKRKQHDNL